MKGKWSIIPDINNLEKSMELSQQYDAAFEYNDFFNSRVYDNETEIKRIIDIYRGLQRHSDRDTLHGVFKDVNFASEDKIIRDRSRELMAQSCCIARELKCKGVVFHTGLIGDLINVEGYVKGWLDSAIPFFGDFGKKFADLEIYIENSFEYNPLPMLSLLEKIENTKNIRLCLDYAHAAITDTPQEDWISMMAGHIGHMHINDNDLIADRHEAPGDGKIDYGEFKVLKEKYSLDVTMLVEISNLDKTARGLKYLSGI